MEVQHRAPTVDDGGCADADLANAFDLNFKKHIPVSKIS